ncbi:hypothetical protein MLD63_06880 [Paracoccus sp. TK19116]|uniref:Capsular polysaccharide transport system permease protein n=1 Tax=Paracoccus albicereus TaxID=2922394 RepID=A0ABT1MPC4_9RHOB|nr:hypothetical protein [Paracoccus albicereus]MCQ0970142.1 hypothetical protein [Paracoccus albicereus]
MTSRDHPVGETAEAPVTPQPHRAKKPVKTDSRTAAELKAEKSAAAKARKQQARDAEEAEGIADAQAQLSHLRVVRKSRRHLVILLSFLLVGVLPIIATAWYLYGRAADQYASYVGFLVRTQGSTTPIGALGGLAELAGKSSTEETDILYKFIQSGALVNEVDKKLDLQSIWTPPTDDPVFGYSGNGSPESLLSHWNRQVHIYYDQGMLDLRVLSFRPEDSRAIAEAILEQSQLMLNRINAVARDDSLSYAQEDLDRAVERLKSSRQAVSSFRQDNRVIDPLANVTGQEGILTSLQAQLADAIVQLGMVRANARSDDPRITQAELRVDVISNEIEQQRKNIASSREDDQDLSRIVSDYEAIEVDRQFAEAAYTAALAAYEEARAEADRNSLYLASYVTPVEATVPEYPRRLRLLAMFSGFILSVWLVGVLIYYGSRDRR